MANFRSLATRARLDFDEIVVIAKDEESPSHSLASRYLLDHLRGDITLLADTYTFLHDSTDRIFFEQEFEKLVAHISLVAVLVEKVMTQCTVTVEAPH